MKKSFSPLFLSALAATALCLQGCRTFSAKGPAAAAPAEDEITAAPVIPAVEDVGTPGTYTEFVKPAEQAAVSYEVESEGLRGRTGKHVSAPTPEREPEPAAKPKKTTVKAPAGGAVHVVKSGEILGRISRKYGVTRQSIIDANGIKNPDKLKVGQQLIIPAKSSIKTTPKKAAPKNVTAKPKKALPAKAGYTVYTVKNGDILGRIANKHGVKQRAILEANGLVNADKLKVGQQLYIPNKGTAVTPVAKTPAAAPAAPKPEAAPAAPAPVAPAAAPEAPAPAADNFLDNFDL